MLTSRDVPWQQVETTPAFRLLVEREDFTTLDRVGRMVFSVQSAKPWPKPDELSVRWEVKSGDESIAKDSAPIKAGALDIAFTLADLKPGRYDVSGELLQGNTVLAQKNAFFKVLEAKAPAQSGRVALQLPRGVPLKQGTYPIVCGVPFPKGALWNKDNVRVVKANGTPVPAQFIVRSRWGHREEASIRWLGVEFQSEPAPAWWPQRKDTRYYLEFGPNIKPVATPQTVRVNDTPEGYAVNTGPLQFLVRRQGFNVLDNIRLNGKAVVANTQKHGLYLVDHEGSVYRAANDSETTLKIEEQNPLRVVLRAEGWYVKDGSDGKKLNWTLPTDKLCKFITRIEAYAGKPYVRVLSTWILTYDTFTVRIRDAGLSLPLQGIAQAEFGVENGAPISQKVTAGGVRMVQHLPHEFVVEDGKAKALSKGKHSGGWVQAASPNAVVSIGHRETWQRFPKELEVLPGAVKMHIWPAHGKEHPEIKQTEHKEIHKLWFAHLGREMNLQMPWEYYFGVSKITGNPDVSISRAGGIAMMGVHSSGMGAGITSDFLLQFAAPAQATTVRETAQAFQTAPHALPDPKWLCASLGIGYVHEYDPEKFADLEAIMEACLRGYWNTQNETGEYGMWLYRTWHHSQYNGDLTWNPYRLYNASHHYDAFMPWLAYARSGNPFYLTQGSANIRMLSDVQVLHYEDPNYPHKEFSGGYKRVVGSMKHDNSFTPWGGDHAVLGHNTCFNALMVAHYLTGDLRLREVLVDEWQKTLLTGRDNPQMAIADLSPFHPASTRNLTNAIGEMLDMYHLTYDPGLLARMSPLFEDYTKNMWDWGQALHNVLLYRGSDEVKGILLKVVGDFREIGLDTMHRERGLWPPDPHRILSSLGPAEGISLAAIIAPEKGYHKEAYIAANPLRRQYWAKQYLNPHERHTAYSTLADFVSFAPRIMYALDRAGARGGEYTWREFDKMQPFPLASAGEPYRSWQKVVVREDKDQEFSVKIIGMIGRGGMPVQVFGVDNQKLIDTVVPTGTYSPYRIKVPKDGKTGQYVIFIRARQNTPFDDLRAPITDLPGEVYHTVYWAYQNDWLPFRPVRYFTRPAGDVAETMVVHPHGKGQLLSLDMKQVLAQGNMADLKAEVAPTGMWIETEAGYNWSTGKPLTLSITPERWFQPAPDKMELKPDISEEKKLAAN